MRLVWGSEGLTILIPNLVCISSIFWVLTQLYRAYLGGQSCDLPNGFSGK